MNEKQTAAIQKFREIVLKAKAEYESLGKIDIGAWGIYDDARAEAASELKDVIPSLRGSTISDLMANIKNLPAFIKQREKYRDIAAEKKTRIVETDDGSPALKIPKIKKSKSGKRGRAKIEIEFPKGRFTIPELAKEKGVSVTTIHNALIALGKKAKIEGEAPRKPGQRGKPTKIWRVLTKD